MHGACIKWANPSSTHSTRCLVICNGFFFFFEQVGAGLCHSLPVTEVVMCSCCGGGWLSKCVLTGCPLTRKRVDLWETCHFTPKPKTITKNTPRRVFAGLTLAYYTSRSVTQSSSADLLTQRTATHTRDCVCGDFIQNKGKQNTLEQNPWLILPNPSLVTLAVLSKQLKTYSDDVNECCFPRVLEADQRQLHLLLPKQRPEPVQKPVY